MCDKTRINNIEDARDVLARGRIVPGVVDDVRGGGAPRTASKRITGTRGCG